VARPCRLLRMFYILVANDLAVATLHAVLRVWFGVAKAVKEICGDTMNAKAELGLKS
jgi:hypothetical protein